MRKLCFVTRTWNRAEVLEETVESRASEVVKYGLDKDVCIFIVDNQSSDATPKVCKKLQNKYHFIKVWRSPLWKKQEELFEIPPNVLDEVSAEFYWFFGDDDILLKDTLPFVWKALNTQEASESVIIHTGHALLKPHSFKIYKGSVLEFANFMGFNQYIGWGASLILNFRCKIDLLYPKFPQDFTQYYLQYREAAFSYNLCILHLHHYDQSLVIDYPICKPLKHLDSKTADRWESENVGWRYFLFAKNLKFMYDNKILTQKLKPKFFKYLTHYLWERFLGEMIASRLGLYTRNPRPDEGWDYTLGIAEIIDDEEIAQDIRSKVKRARELCDEFTNIKKEYEIRISTHQSLLNSPEIRFLKNRLETLQRELVGIYQECVRPKFSEGWAGEGMEDRVLYFK